MPRERWLITGASGQLGSHVVTQLAADPACAALLALAGRQDVPVPPEAIRRIDLGDTALLLTCVREFGPTHVLHLGAMTAVADCHARPHDAERINVGATAVLGAIATELGTRLVHCSTDMVFDGEHAPYRETDKSAPLSIYGRTKLAAECALSEFPRTLIVRVPLMYGLPRNGRRTTFTQQLAALRKRDPLRLFVDEFRTPIWLGDAARALIGLARSDATGILHIAGPARLSRLELIEQCARVLGIENPNLVPIRRTEIAAPEPRPADLSLDAGIFNAHFPALRPGPIRPEVFEE